MRQDRSTTVEIILYYLTTFCYPDIYQIYNSRNYSILLNTEINGGDLKSTTVEIILYYLTYDGVLENVQSTTVEIILYYLTPNLCICTIFFGAKQLYFYYFI